MARKNRHTSNYEHMMALAKKAEEARDRNSNIDEDIIVVVDDEKKARDEAFSKALEKVFELYGDKSRQNYSSVMNLLLALNIDEFSVLAVSDQAEHALSTLGFTSHWEQSLQNEDLFFLNKKEIKNLMFFLLENYQQKHPEFASYFDIEKEFPSEVAKLLEASNYNKLVTYIAIKACYKLITEEDYKLLSSGNEASIKRAFYKLKNSEQTKKVLFPIAPEMANLIRSFLDNKNFITDNQKHELAIPSTDSKKVNQLVSALNCLLDPNISIHLNYIRKNMGLSIDKILDDPITAEFLINNLTKLS